VQIWNLLGLRSERTKPKIARDLAQEAGVTLYLDVTLR
ncbi:unnamed protein product, partial [Acidithrix sp. C25]